MPKSWQILCTQELWVGGTAFACSVCDWSCCHVLIFAGRCVAILGSSPMLTHKKLMWDWFWENWDDAEMLFHAETLNDAMIGHAVLCCSCLFCTLILFAFELFFTLPSSVPLLQSTGRNWCCHRSTHSKCIGAAFWVLCVELSQSSCHLSDTQWGESKDRGCEMTNDVIHDMLYVKPKTRQSPYQLVQASRDWRQGITWVSFRYFGMPTEDQHEFPICATFVVFWCASTGRPELLGSFLEEMYDIIVCFDLCLIVVRVGTIFL